MKLTVLFTICLTLLLAACGGGNGSATVVPSITSVTPNQLKYSQQSKFTVVGTHLDKGVTLTSSACDTIKKESGATDKQIVFSCTPSATGKIKLSFALTGTSAYTSEHTIPEPRVLIKTSMGDIELELNASKAPKTVKNFMAYVNSGFYSNTVFHRVIKSFMIQGGGFDTSLHQKTVNDAIDLESGNGLKNERGTIAMARTSVAKSATSQFFINSVDNSFLDAKKPGEDGYAVFGKTINTSSLTVVDNIEKVTTTTVNGMADVPITPVIITEVTQTQ